MVVHSYRSSSCARSKLSRLRHWNPHVNEIRWRLSTIFKWTRRSFLVRCSSMRASTRHSMKADRYCARPREGSHSFPSHSWFISPNASPLFPTPMPISRGLAGPTPWTGPPAWPAGAVNATISCVQFGEKQINMSDRYIYRLAIIHDLFSINDMYRITYHLSKVPLYCSIEKSPSNIRT